MGDIKGTSNYLDGGQGESGQHLSGSKSMSSSDVRAPNKSVKEISFCMCFSQLSTDPTIVILGTVLQGVFHEILSPQFVLMQYDAKK